MTTQSRTTRLMAKLAILASLFVLGSAPPALAKDYSTSTVAVGGYDPVMYHAQGKAMRGSGDHVAVYNGETYLFANKRNRKKFAANPEKYAPAYGGYCAYGVSVGKKFVGDPEVWKVVGGKLYLNLNAKIQKLWNKDIPGNIAKAESHWPRIHDRAPSEL